MSGSAKKSEVALAALPPTDPRSLPHLPNLSARELEIVRLVAKGMPNKIIADVLEISPWTVATYLRRSFGKLQVHSKAELVAKVLGTL